MQKLATFRKVKPPAFRAYAPEGKSRNYTSRLGREQVIPQIDPREIVSAFHRAVAEIAEKGHFWMETN